MNRTDAGEVAKQDLEMKMTLEVEEMKTTNGEVEQIQGRRKFVGYRGFGNF